MPGKSLKNVVRYGWDLLSQEEGTVDSGSMTPGHLVEKTATGYQEHSTDAGVLDQVAFAKDMRGRGFEVDPDVTYEDGDLITFVKANSGVGITAMLAAGTDLATAGNATVDGDAETRLVSAGDGTLRAFDADGDDAVVAVAKETKDNSGAAAGEATPLKVEVVR